MNLAKITVTSSKPTWKKATVHRSRVLEDDYQLQYGEKGGIVEKLPIQPNLPFSVS